jgi:hypothetical protein
MAAGAWGQAVDATHWQSGTMDLTEGWRAQDGDDRLLVEESRSAVEDPLGSTAHDVAGWTGCR